MKNDASKTYDSAVTSNLMNKPKTASKEDSAFRTLFEKDLKDIYWAEKALTKAIPKMIVNATSLLLIKALDNHLSETEGHIDRLETIFKVIGVKAIAIKCDAMASLIKEADDVLASMEKGEVRDAGIIFAIQKIEHYEIATYGTLRAFAKTLGENKVVSLLEDTLKEEKDADAKLTEIAYAYVNDAAATE